MVCVAMGPNFTLKEVVHDEAGRKLYISGYQSRGYCASEYEDVKKYARLQLELSLFDLEFEVQIEETVKKGVIAVDENLQRLFEGEFSSPCGRCSSSPCGSCSLQLEIPESDYTLRFTTDFNDEIPLEYNGECIMLFSLLYGESKLADFIIGFERVERVNEQE